MGDRERLRKPGLLRRWWSRVRARWAGRTIVRWRLSCDDKGIAVDWNRVDSLESGRDELQWADIVEVVAFKRDINAFDLVCIWFERADGTGLEIDEDDDGCEEVVDALPAHLTGCRPVEDWWSEVVQPPFAENRTVIWQRRPEDPGPPAGPVPRSL